MKTITTLLLTILSIGHGYCQMVVTDPGLMTYLTTTDAEKMASEKSRFLTQLGEMKKQAQFLKEAKEKYDKVNGAIKQTAQVRLILWKQERLVSSTLYNIESIKRSDLSLQAKTRAVKSLMNNKERAEDLFQLVKKLINSVDLKMNDSERLQYLSEVEAKIDRSQSQVNSVEKKVARLDRLNKTYND